MNEFEPVNNQILIKQCKNKAHNIIANRISTYIMFMTLIIMNFISQILSRPYSLYDGGDIISNSEFSHLSNSSEVCACDFKPNTCDPYCCCDPLCNNYRNGTKQWEYYYECWIKSTKVHRYPKCLYSDQIYNLDDLYTPVRVLSQNYKKGLCVSFDNSGLNNTLQRDTKLNNTKDFENFLQDNDISFINETLPYYKNYTAIETIIPSSVISNFNASEFKNYSINDNIIFKNNSETATNYFTFKFPMKGLYGECEHDFDSVKYLKNNKITCGQILVSFLIKLSY